MVKVFLNFVELDIERIGLISVDFEIFLVIGKILLYLFVI